MFSEEERAGYLLAFAALCLWGTIGSLAKMSQVGWSVHYFWFSAGELLTAIVISSSVYGLDRILREFESATSLEVACGLMAGVTYNIGSMCFMSSCQLLSLIFAYIAVMGIELTVGTILLALISPVTHLGLLVAAVIASLCALALDVLAQLQLELDSAAAVDKDEAALHDKEESGRNNETSSLVTSPESAMRRLDVPVLPRRGDGLSSSSTSTSTTSSLGRQSFTPVSLQDSNTFHASSSYDQGGELAVPSMLRAHSIEFFSDKELIMEPATKADATRRAARRGIGRAVIAGILLAIWPALEAVAVRRGERVECFLAIFAVGHTMAFSISAPARRLYLARPSSMSSSKYSDPSIATFNTRAAVLGIIAGIFWFLGALCVFQSGTLLGSLTVSVSVARCSPLVAVAWGIIYWREAKHASLRAILFISLSLSLYCLTIVFVAMSS